MSFPHTSPSVCLVSVHTSLSLLQIMTERKNAKAMAGGSLHDRMQAGLDLPLQGRHHTNSTLLSVGWNYSVLRAKKNHVCIVVCCLYQDLD